MIYKKTQYVLAALAGFASICFATEPHEAQKFAQFVQWNEGSPYAGQCVVRVRTTSQAQLDQVLEIATDVWSERIGQGPLELIKNLDMEKRIFGGKVSAFRKFE